MKYSYLGKTGMKVPVLSFGASSLGGVFRSVSEAEAIRAVFTVIEHGMTFIDVSPYYGHTKAETVLGEALTELPRESFLLSTKVGRYGANGVNLWDYSAQRTRESVFESMERLHVDYIDLINVHDIEFADLSQVINETLPTLVELREKGLVGHVGITDLQLENLKWVIDRVPEGTVESVLNFCHYSLNDDRLADWHPAPAALVEACRKASDYCLSQGYPIEKLAIQFSVSNPRIGTTLFSSANPDNVLKNIQYIEEPID